MKITFAPILLICLFLLSCDSTPESTESVATISTNPVENLAKIWRLNDYQLTDPDGILKADQKESLQRRALRDGYQLCFIPNNTGNSIIGEVYEEFDWTYDVDKATITLKKKNGNTELTNVKIEQGEKYLTLTALENQNAQITMIATSKLADNIEEEPFHPANNQWRIKATKHEDLPVLKQRLLNFVTHYKYLFKASVDNPKRTFTNSKSDGIILIYKGAIGFIKEANIPTEWTYTFYDEYQAKDAYIQFKKYMNNKPMKKEATKDWKPVNLEILKELEAKIKADLATK